jgi:hypothetical protein
VFAKEFEELAELTRKSVPKTLLEEVRKLRALKDGEQHKLDEQRMRHRKAIKAEQNRLKVLLHRKAAQAQPK